MKINQKENRILKNWSWKVKKHIAETICVFVVIFSMMLSLCVSTPYQVTENAQSRVSGNYQIDNNGTSVSLKLNSTQVRQGADENTVVDLETTGSSKRDNRTDTRSSENQTQVVQDTVPQSGEQSESNAVVKNPEPLSLISAIYENYGQLPELEEAVTRYQYPVEIGYAVDKNYDGRQTEKDSILNITMDTTLEKEDSIDGNMNYEEDGETGEDSPEAAENDSVKENESDSEDEQKEADAREKFKKEIWSRLYKTEPVEVQNEKKLQIEERKSEPEKEEAENLEQDTSETIEETAAEELPAEASTTETGDVDETAETGKEQENTTEEQDTTNADEIVKVDAGYYIISGMMRDGKDAFVSDIEIKPSGVDGFNKVRLGKDGEFKDSIVITEDAASKDLELYFTDGERITARTIFTYTKDTRSPEIAVKEEDVKVLSSELDKIYCTNHSDVAVTVEDGGQDQSAGLEKISTVYGDKIVYLVDSLENPKITLPQDFFGRVLFNCEDRAGNTSDIISQYYLVEQNAPEVTFSDSEICTAPYTLWIDVADTGHIISGIDNIECTVNGERYDIADLRVQENVQLTDTLEVPSKAGFSIPFDKEGSYEIMLQVTDHAGNVTTEQKTIEVTQPELVAVYMPQEFTIHIDPQRLLGREQIFSDNITLNNVSNVDIQVNIEDIIVTVKDEVSDTGIVKDCDIYLVAPDTGEKIKLKNGRNKDIYSYCLPLNTEGESTNLYFVGDTAEGSDEMWRSSDITIDVKLSFEKWKDN